MTKCLRQELHNVLHPVLINSVQSGVSQINCTTQEGLIFVKHGILPPLFKHDCDFVKIIDEKSWILDIDSMKLDTKIEFDSKVLINNLEELAKRAYAFFYWSVTKKFLIQFGGKIDGNAN